MNKNKITLLDQILGSLKKDGLAKENRKAAKKFLDQYPAKDDEKKLGLLPPSLQELYGLYLSEVNKLDILHEALLITESPLDLTIKTDDFILFTRRVVIIAGLFWTSVYDYFNLDPEKKVGVRVNFNVVLQTKCEVFQGIEGFTRLMEISGPIQ